MTTFYRGMAILLLMLCSGCGRADISEARRDHLLAGDHAWIDLTLAPPNTTLQVPKHTTCSVAVAVNGENVLIEAANLAEAAAHRTPIGYRFPVSAGQLTVSLQLADCVKQPLNIQQTLTAAKDTLLRVDFDGQQLATVQSESYQPMTLDAVHAEIVKSQSTETVLHDSLQSTRHALWFSLGLNSVILLLLLLRRK